jgi:hypothetical protein
VSIETGYRDMSQAMSLLTTTTGFVDVYIIEAHEQLPWLVPQNLVLAALSAEGRPKQIEWRDKILPVLSLSGEGNNKPVALVVQGIKDQHLFALLIDKMPDTGRIRISSLRDMNMEPVSEVFSFQIVKMGEGLYQVPDFDRIDRYVFNQHKQ